jgi:hypothetical protein
MNPVGAGASEGDVETQVVLPLLTRGEFLALKSTDIRSKEGISARDIGKGSKRKIGYIPDFCAYRQALPLLVVEAKSPAVDVSQAYGESCLYAGEINRSFPAGLNPCSVVLATNGVELLAGHWDASPEITTTIEELKVGSSVLDVLIGLCGNDALDKIAQPLSERLRSADFRRPFNHGAGQAQILSRIEPNTFAADLAPILRRYFSSRDQNTDPDIYSRAYISSNEITSYDRILESFLKDRLARSKARVEITTSRHKSQEITKTISRFGEVRPTSGDLQLVTGGVGAGKSLFARRYREYLQPGPLEEKNHWAFLNFNTASPQDFLSINDWVAANFAESVLEEGAPIDLRDADDQERVFANDLADRKAFYDRMEASAPGRGGLERARDIEGWRQDPLKLTRGIARYLQGDRGENLIVVFDNVDRRETSAQLSAFEAALWFMDQTRALVILQMRDSTFEAYKNEPPLDTYRSGQIFHISPPRLVDVVKRRLELSLEAIDGEAPEQVKYRTAAGAQISYPKRRAGEFLRGIYAELFQTTTNLARILEALAGRNVRRALDMFMAILTSGHMPEEVIASVAQGNGYRSFPEYRILRALMRQDFRFFNNDSGFVANLLHCNPRWVRPSNFLLPEILFYLIGRRKVRGDNGQMGFVSIARLLSDLEALGFVRSDILDACHFGLSKELIEVETSSATTIREIDCVKATASGWVHMRMLSSRIEYLASIMPTTAINDSKFSNAIFDLMQTENRTGHPSYQRYIAVVEQLEPYLRRQHQGLMIHPGYSDMKQSGATYLLGKVQEALRFARREGAGGPVQLDLLDG